MYFITIDGRYIIMPSTLALLCADTEDQASEIHEAVEFAIHGDRPRAGRAQVCIDYQESCVPEDGKIHVVGEYVEKFINRMADCPELLENLG